MSKKKNPFAKKSVPQPRILEEPPLIVNCICPHCGHSYLQGKVTGTYLARTCPACNHVLEGKDFDARVKELLGSKQAPKAELDAINENIDRLSAIIDHTKWWHIAPVRHIAARKKDKLLPKKQELQKNIKRINKQVNVLAQSRYYSSEWYVRTQIPLKRTVVEPFEIAPVYDVAGKWYLSCSSADEVGFAAEYLVGEKLFERAKDPDSALYRAQIIPNVYLPQERKYDDASFWTQADFVVLTKQAAFVLEVKRRAAYLVVPPRFEFTNVFTTKNAEAFEAVCEKFGPWSARELERLGFSSQLSCALRQNETHAYLFSEACSEYSYDDIYEQTVFVKPHGFNCGERGFVKNVNVSIASELCDDFIVALEQLCEQLPDIHTQEEVDAIGSRVLYGYGDLNQKRGIIHKQCLAQRERRVS